MYGIHYYQNLKKKSKGLARQKEGGKQGRSPSSFHQKATSHPTSQRTDGEQERKLEETISPKLQKTKNQKGCNLKWFQHGQNLDGIQGKRGKKNETTPFPK
ncbi:hypothetical protein O181_032034 [Austropuccinia psidii MF-1]|uniref:Uncharacterized protein n=1 Tax=Austropuccinia psidii MF-1 TaxID=1389203 RepID=A0A9Q3CWR7_9BASI|nr:hypothetical protein [Austropuccinia psidii MF-1]